MKLFIQETNWWAYKTEPGKIEKEYQFEENQLKIWKKIVVSKEEANGTVNFAFKILCKKKNQLKLKVYGDHLIYGKELLPITIELKENEEALFSTQSLDAGSEYTLLLK